MEKISRPKLQPGAQKVLIWMEGSVLVCMGVVIMSGILSLYGTQKLLETFDGNCIYTSNISFVHRLDSMNGSARNSLGNQAPQRIRRSEVIPEAITIRTSTNISSTNTTKAHKFRTKKIPHIFKHLETTYVTEEEIQEEDEPEVKQDVEVLRSQVKTQDDFTFLATMQVDVIKTIWAPQNFCEYVLYNQVLSMIAAMICTTMLVLYNTAGKAQLDWGIPKPWRIVFPAVISFGIMTIVSIVYLVITNSAYKDFCGGLSSKLETKTLSCKKLINALNPLAYTPTINPGLLYDLHYVSIRLTLTAWLLAFVIMAARMFFVIDFRLVHVSITTYSQKRKSLSFDTASSSDEVEEIEEKTGAVDEIAKKTLDMKTDRSGSSREDVDEFQSAHSDPDRTLKSPSRSESLVQHQANVHYDQDGAKSHSSSSDTTSTASHSQPTISSDPSLHTRRNEQSDRDRTFSQPTSLDSLIPGQTSRDYDSDPTISHDVSTEPNSEDPLISDKLRKN